MECSKCKMQLNDENRCCEGGTCCKECCDCKDGKCETGCNCGHAE